MGISGRASLATLLASLALFQGHLIIGVSGHYREALSKALIFLEAQRSGKLPPNNRVPWRGDSALDDGKLENVDLVGGYYDAGDNVKYGMPMAFTITTLAWAAIAYSKEIQAAGEMENVHTAIRWGTDYFLKAAARRNRLYVQVGDPVADHQCWVRPENMKTPRTVLKIDEKTPGAEIAAETAAAMAASSLVFRDTDPRYARRLLNKAKLLFQFAKTHKATFDGECPFYCSNTGYNDELLWAATWLYIATKKPVYIQYVKDEAMLSPTSEFNWDNKYAAAEILLTKLFLEGDQSLSNFKCLADAYICNVLPDSPVHQIYTTPGGMLYYRDGANSQYVTGAALLFTVYGDLLAQHNLKVQCDQGAQFEPSRLHAFAKKQIDYLLGVNPQGRSYMVGFGTNPPKEAHHRGASMPKFAANEVVSCPMSFVNWFNKNQPNPNELTGAILGGPDKQDHFSDLRWTSVYTEPCTYINSLAVGPLAKLASIYGDT